MKIALYYPWIYIKGGVGRTILKLIQNSRHEWTIFTSHFDPQSSYPEFKDIKVIQLNKVPVKRSYWGVLKAAITVGLEKIDLREYDYLWVHSEGVGDFITLRNHSRPVICFCHTPLKVIHDPCARRIYFENNPLKIPLYFFFSCLFKFVDKLAWRHYSHVFCVSQEVRQRIISAQLIEPEKIEVIYRGVDTDKIRAAWKYDKYFLHPARIKWWKNIELSISAFDIFLKKYPSLAGFKLIIAGQVDEGSKGYYQKILKLSRSINNIEIIPNPGEDKLADLYRNCYCVISTTLNEDWGLVPLEAMAYGKPVIAVNRGGPLESVVDKQSGFLVRADSLEFSRAMQLLAQDTGLVETMGRQARVRSLKYDWRYFIEKVDNFFDLLGSGSRGQTGRPQ